MILLSKVFPTLDCASCISTPKMAADDPPPQRHDPDLQRGRRDHAAARDGRFRATIKRKARFVNETTCTGCQLCETACTVAVPDQFNADMVPRRAAYIAFPQAVPKKAVIDRAGSSPCSYDCPAGIQAHGYVSLVRSGEYEKAFAARARADAARRHASAAPAMRRAKLECTRGSLEGPLPIRRLKRFIADIHYEQFDGPGVAIPRPNGKRVAVVGSGPGGPHRGLAARAQGLRASRSSRPRPRPAAASASPSRRTACPEVVEQRHRQRHGPRRRDRHEHAGRGPRRPARRRLRRRAPRHRHPALDEAAACPASSSPASQRRSPSCARSSSAKRVDLAGKRVVVIGGGNVAIDAARTRAPARRRATSPGLPASRAEMPAHDVEGR